MRQETRNQVHQLLKNFAKASIKNFDVEKLKRAYPFHQLFFDEIGLVAFKQERSVVTKMGMNLYPELARLIASDAHSDVEREKNIRGILGEATVNAIGRIVRELRSNQREPNHTTEVLEILNATYSSSTLEEIDVRVIADLFVGNLNGIPYFFEIKTPTPNLDICAESKSKILTFIALLHGRNPKAYLAFPYNPFVTREGYKHWATKKIMDMNDEVLMGEEFWDVIGGNGTFTQLLEVIENVGDELREEKD